MTRRAIAIHEASHAVVGLCLGRRGLLKRISIMATPEMKGGCHWSVSKGKCPPEERGQELGILLAGPIGQTIFATDSLGDYAEAFELTIFQSEDILEKAGCAGWASTDLNLFLALRRRNWPTDQFEDVERLIRPLLMRPSVASAIMKLAESLETHEELDGIEGERIIEKHLQPEDYVGKEYLQ